MLLKRVKYIYKPWALIWVLVSMSQCSPQTGKSLLTIFFDGVPGDTVTVQVSDDTVGSQPAEGEMVPQAEQVSSIVVHYPYGERECGTCHDPGSLGSMVEPQPGLCYMCHDDFGDNYPVLHGPVAGGYCTSCHDPHTSREMKLLRYTGQSLCLHCHQLEDILKNEMHADLEGMECTDCHNPHGGEDHFILY